jgi:hypothetical protein
LKTDTPFSPTQQTLILCAIATFVLMACINLIRNYHPRFRRSPIFRLTPLGMLVLALAAGGCALIAFYAIDFVKLHPLRFLSVPAFGTIVFFICAQIDAYRERALPQPSGTSTPSKQWQLSPRALVWLATWYAGVLACSLVTVPLSLYGELFGPQGAVFLAVIAFVLSIAVFFLAQHPWGIGFLKECPTGLAGRFPELQCWRKHIERLLLPIFLIAFLSVTAMFASSRAAGVPSDGLPALASRDHYNLTNHGRRTEVSALRFWVASAGGLVGWHAGALLVSLLALYGLFYGELPPQFKRDFKKSTLGERP